MVMAYDVTMIRIDNVGSAHNFQSSRVVLLTFAFAYILTLRQGCCVSETLYDTLHSSEMSCYQN